MATTPTISPSPAAGNSPSGIFTPVAHTHPFTAITGLRFGTNGRVEPVYDAANVFANGEIIALYNASSTPGAFAAPSVPAVTVRVAIEQTDGPPGDSESNLQPQRFLAEGRITQQEFNRVTTPTPAEGPGAPLPRNKATSTNSPPAEGTEFPLSYSLGNTGFTLGNIIREVTFPRFRVVAQKGLTQAQIVTNITDWTRNIWIPFKAKYPTAFITNTFRQGEGQGQHGTGQAGDIQIRGYPNVDMDQVGLWCVENLPIGQLLVEFTPGLNAWIHLSYENGTGITTKKINKIATMNAATFEFVPGIHKSMLVKARMLRAVT
jgi:hypothetical protein